MRNMTKNGKNWNYFLIFLQFFVFFVLLFFSLFYLPIVLQVSIGWKEFILEFICFRNVENFFQF